MASDGGDCAERDISRTTGKIRLSHHWRQSVLPFELDSGATRGSDFCETEGRSEQAEEHGGAFAGQHFHRELINRRIRWSCDTSSVSEILPERGLSILPHEDPAMVRRRVAELVKRSNRLGQYAGGASPVDESCLKVCGE
jgi:hypothetical protein